MSNDYYNLLTLCCAITDNCNLKCAGCDHFAPLVNKVYMYPLDKFEINMKQLSKVTKGNVKRINIAGGEPLLNKNVLEYVKIAISFFPNSRLELRTNGTLLKYKNENFFNELNSQSCYIRVSDYRFNRKKNNFLTIDKTTFFTHYLSRIPDSLENICGCYKDFTHAIPLIDEDGNFYYCLFTYVIKYYNNFFNTDIPIVKGLDYNNIFDDDFIEKSNYLQHVKKPFCYYCHKAKITKWRPYVNNINYWDYDG